MNRPRILLLDEPLGALDLKLRKEMQLELKQLQVQLGITFVYVTHDQEEALTMSDRIVLMRQGKIEQIGGPRDLYDRPGSRVVSASSLIVRHIDEGDPQLHLQLLELQLHLLPELEMEGTQWLIQQENAQRFTSARDGPLSCCWPPGELPR